MTIPTEVQQYIDSLPDSCMYINLSGKGLDTLPDLSRFTNLYGLDCSFNKFTKFPKLPDSLTQFDCQSNNLTKLPKLPSNLWRLLCMDNQITSLPKKFPSKLRSLVCSGNPVHDTIRANFKLPYVIAHEEFDRAHPEIFVDTEDDV